MDANNSFFVGGLFIKIKIEFPGLSQHFHLDGFLRAPPAYSASSHPVLCSILTSLALFPHDTPFFFNFFF